MKIPGGLQGVLWSIDIDRLDLIRDKVYIIHQVLAYGTLKEILWLLKVYTNKDIIDTFTCFPYKDYIKPRFNFVKNIILGLKNISMNEARYVKNIPRDIRY